MNNATPYLGFQLGGITMQTEVKGQPQSFAIINYVDLDNNMAQIATSGQITATSDYHLDEQIKKLQSQGYELVTNGFAQQRFDNQTHLLTFKHQRQVVTGNHLDHGVEPNEVAKVGHQIVHYQGAGSRTPRDSQTTVQLSRSIIFDKVTNKRMGSKPWRPVHSNYPVIGSPSVQGYTPSQAMVGGHEVDPAKPDVEYTVDYRLIKQASTGPQTAVIRFLDIDNHNQAIITPVEVTGQPNAVINYDPTETIKQLINRGYELVDNGFNPDGAPQFFDANDQFEQTYIITLQHRHANVSPQHPQASVNADQYQRTTKLTVQFSGAGDKTPQPIVQAVNWEQTITVDLVTGELITASPWQADAQSYKPVAVPVVNGFHSTVKTVAAQKVTGNNDVVNVSYQPDVVENASQEPAAPTVLQKPMAIVNYVDLGDESKQLASSGLISGEVGQKIAVRYSTADEIEQLKKDGYQVLYNNFDRNREEHVFSNDQLQTFTVALVKTNASTNLRKLSKAQSGNILNPVATSDDLSVVFDALKSLNSLLGLMMKNNFK